MNILHFMSVLTELGGDFYTGVPDSLLAPFCDHIMETHGISDKHIVAANEGAAVGLAAGRYLATGKPSVVYMQNSGLGNAVNPICSLLKLYDIPVIFVIGWRGEPGIPDEPQHTFQGEITLPLLDCLEIPYKVISKEDGININDTNINGININDTNIDGIKTFKKLLMQGKSVAFVIKKSALKNEKKMTYASNAAMSREDILKIILQSANPQDVFVCTTGKLSREVFEIRASQVSDSDAHHSRDFLTVGSMGHSLMIAHGIALAQPDRTVFCLDGDGAAIMHLGSLAVVGVHSPKNLVHVVVNNGAHETVGGMPVVSAKLDMSQVAQTLGYRHTFRVSTKEDIQQVLAQLTSLEGPVFIEAISNLLSRKDLGRPTTTPLENKAAFMDFLSKQ